MERGISDNIKTTVDSLFKRYNHARSHNGRKKSQDNIDQPCFWDVIVLTTFDAAQKRSFEQQIKERKRKGLLPLVEIYVVADPPGMKLGCGGSTLHVLQTLNDKFGQDLSDKKLLIIHSGGSSQRLPSYSAQGKIFSPVPAKGLCNGNSIGQMLDLKLALYLPFCDILGPGAFITCSDDIETYHFNPDDLDAASLKSADIVALAHPSNIETGKNHGVYIFDKSQVSNLHSHSAAIVDCLEVLQKPSSSLMHGRGAVLQNDRGEEMVYSDSVFWMSFNLCQSFLSWYRTHSPLLSELDAYAHFLPCLGSRLKGISPDVFSDYRSQMFPLLKDCNFKVMILNESHFYHLGTMREYLLHFTHMKSFIKELDIVKNTSHSNTSVMQLEETDGYVAQNIVMIGCYIGKSLRVTDGASAVIEWCYIETPVLLFDGTILSNCTIKECSAVSFLTERLYIPGDFFYHTLPVASKGRQYFVTVAFEIDADLKKLVHSLSSLHVCSCPLDQLISVLGYSKTTVLPEDTSLSLWNVKLFPAGHTPEESFWLTHNMINRIQNYVSDIGMQTEIIDYRNLVLFSMKNAAEAKDLDQMLLDRDILMAKISDIRNNN